MMSSKSMLAGPPREEQLRALRYAKALVEQRIPLEGPANRPLLQSYVAELASLLAAAPSSAEGKEELPKLNGSQIRKGTGDVLKDLAHAQRFTESIQDQWGGPLGLEIDFIDRALRVAMAEIKNLRNRNAK